MLLRGKVAPKWCGLRKSAATPGQWAAHLDYSKSVMRRYNATPSAREAKRRWWHSPAGRALERARASRPPSLRRRVASNLRRRLRHAVCRDAKSGSAVRDLGCSVADLKAHLERQFLPGMSWENWGTGPGKWQIDHVYPLSLADLTDRGQLLAACNWQNLQPLWFEDNLRKSSDVTPAASALFGVLLASFAVPPVPAVVP